MSEPNDQRPLKQHFHGGHVYVIATPLGNLGDITARALQSLRDVHVIYAEDTRRTRVLLDHFGIQKPLRSLHTHNEGDRVAEVLAHLENNESVALVSDAGTPAVSDPGAHVVEHVHAAGYRVVPIPGPSAMTAALSVAGFGAASHDVLFVGFLPVKGVERRAVIQRIAEHAGVVVLFEAPHRARATLEDLAQADPQRAACLCRELTKIYEEVRRESIGSLAQWAQGDVLGEITLVLGPVTCVAAEITKDDRMIDHALQRCLQAGLSRRDAIQAVAAVYELPRKRVYARCASGHDESEDSKE